MEVSFTQRLSFKQAGLTVLVAFILGTLLSVIQVGVDYASEDAAINREIDALLRISHNPAARIAYNIDAELAQELVLGLLTSPAILSAQLVDNTEMTLASVSRQPASSRYRFISDYLFGARRHFEAPLFISHTADAAIGYLRLEVDTFAFGNHFLYRSMLNLVTGFARSLLLALILLVLFYFMLTKPLVEVIRAISARDLRIADRRPLPYPPRHRHDEIGELVRVTNQQFSSIAWEIEQRRQAEDRLTHYLNELETMVSERTAELEATNTRLLDSNRELEQARQTALEMAQARSAFLANMSHEIRTPLNGLLGMLALSLDGPMSAEQHQQLSIAHDSGKVLMKLLNDVLDLSKFEAGQLELERIPFDPGSLVEETASLLSQNAAGEVELTCLIDPHLPEQVLGDPTRVRQIVSNLLSNALKFTRCGRVDVRVCASADAIRICVDDTGIGIDEEARARIFQPFAQGGAGIARQFGGTGLGLALARRLCETMGGQLSLRTEVGQGSHFCASLPLPARGPAAAQPSLSGRVALLGASGSGLDELLAMLLPPWGLDYRRLEADAALHGVEADLLIGDDPLALSLLRPHTAVPMLLVTAYGSFLSGERLGELEPLEQMARPLARQTLLQALRRGLRQQPGEPEVAATTTRRVEQRARVLLVEDNPVNQMVAKGMLVKLGYQVLLATDGAEALDMLDTHAVDLVLMDCNMPVMDGYEATRRIRRSDRHPGLPVLALTANALQDERERCRAAGMDDYLAKPFRREELASLLERWLPVGAGN